MSSETLPLAGTLDARPHEARGWSLPARVGFRFAFVFLLLVNVPLTLRFLPGFGEVELHDPLVTPLLVKLLFGIDRVRAWSADTPYNYAAMATYAILAAVAAGVWSIVDRKRLAHPRLLEVLRVYVRFILAQAMIVYGASKLVPAQFGPPSLDKLVQPLGDSSPMGLMWAFIGFSAGYQMFTGAFELLGGILLTIRRTVLLGALIVVGVMINVVTMNLSYDVTVKLYSMQLLLLAVFLVIPSLHRLLRLFVLNQPVEPDRSEPLVRDRRLVALWLLLVAVYVGYLLRSSYKDMTEVNAMVSPIRGIWEVERITVNGIERPPLVTDLTRWRRFVFHYSYNGSFYRMNDQRLRINTRYDTAKRTIQLISRESKRNSMLSYQQPDASTLIVTGTLDGENIHAVCKRAPENFFLNRRGFHWINEKPLNR